MNLLQSMQNRENLTGAPELGLKSAIVHRDNLDDYGDLVYEALAKVCVSLSRLSVYCSFLVFLLIFCCNSW